MKFADVVIIGGGVTGLTTAIRLRELGVAKVVIIEREFVGAGQSGRAAGIVRSLVGNSSVAAMLQHSIGFFSTFNERYHAKITPFRIGYLLVNEAAATGQLDSVIAAAAEAGCTAKRISSEEARELQPGLRLADDDIFAFEAAALHVDPMTVVHALSLVARKMGVEIIEGAEVEHIRIDSGKVVDVLTKNTAISAPQVLIATASWGARMLAKLEVAVPVFPHRIEMAFYASPLESPLRLARIISDARTTLYMRPEGPDQIFVGWREGDRINSTKDLRYADPDNYRQTASYSSLKDMSERLSHTLPFMKDGFIHRTYACVYDYTPDAMPILDSVPEVQGLYVALGFSGGGFSLSPWVGSALAEFITTGAKSPELSLLSASRFAENKPVNWSNVSPVRPDHQPATLKAPKC